MRYVIGILFVFALAVMGCSETSGDGGNGGVGGFGGVGGDGGNGGVGGGTGQVVRVFVTLGVASGALGGLEGADTDCTNSAAGSVLGLSGTWTAWLSDSSADAKDRIRDGEYQLVTGIVVANSKADLTDGTLDHEINMNEHGIGNILGTEVWTGTGADGTYLGMGSSCLDWSSNADTESGRVGNKLADDATWTDSVGRSCDNLRRLYCFAD